MYLHERPAMDFTTAEKQRIWEALLEYDPLAYAKPPIPPEDDAIYFDGYLHLTGLLKVAEVVAEIKARTGHP